MTEPEPEPEPDPRPQPHPHAAAPAGRWARLRQKRRSRRIPRLKPRLRTRLMAYLITLAVIFSLAVTFVWFAQRAVMFPRYLVDASATAPVPDDAEQWHIESPAGPVEAWFLPAPGASADRPGPAVIFAHGNGEVIDHWPDMLQTYRDMGVSVLLPEFRGYGRSAGSPSQHAITTDFIAFHDRLAARPDVDADRIVYHGRSIGCGALASLAMHRAPRAMILQSSFTSAAAMARGYLVPRFLLRDPFDVLAVVKQYTGPVLLLHGKQDQVIPVTHAQRLHDAAPDSTLRIYDHTGHNDLPPENQYWRDIQTFLNHHRIPPDTGTR